MNRNKTITVKIGTMTYRLQAGDDELYVRETAAIADDLIRQSAKRYPEVNQVTNTVLALLNAIDAMRQSIGEKEAAVAEREQQAALTAEAEADLMRVNEQFWDMKKDLLYYRNLCDVYERKLAGAGAEQDAKPPRRKGGVSERQQSFDDVAEDSEAT